MSTKAAPITSLLAHFGLTRHPFSRRTPADAVVHHRGFAEALARLRFCVELDGIAMLVAEAGCGKSLLLGVLADSLQDADWTVHYFAHTSTGPFGLINVLARQSGLGPRRSRAETAQALLRAWHDDQTNHLLVIDEAHELPDATLEDIRLLTIGEFDRDSPFLLLLAGHPRLDERLAEPTHHALDQRVTAVARLAPLGVDEVRAYVQQRLAAAGLDDRPLLEPDAVDALADASAGIPRMINNLATAALIVAASRGRRLVTAQDVRDAQMDRGRSMAVNP
jgi:type II secretory pathway predicted ATPase ExeA